MKHFHVLAFLNCVRELHPEIEHACLHGKCFRLYMLLASCWPEAEPWYDGNHVITKIDEKYYDIRGQVLPEKSHTLFNDAKTFNGAYQWDRRNV